MTARASTAACLTTILLVGSSAGASAADPVAADPAAVAPIAAPVLGSGAAERKGEDDALLLSSAALAQLQAARSGRAAPRPPALVAPQPTLIHLSAIVHHGAEDWRIWLNGRSVTPGSSTGAVRVLEVTPDWVALTWQPPTGGAPVRFRLHPNQSYMTENGRVVEGRPATTAGTALAPPPAPPKESDTP